MKLVTTKTAGAIGLLCGAMAMAGCSGKKNDPQMSPTPGVTDVSAAPAPLVIEPAAAPTPAPVAEQPVYSDALTQAPAAGPAPAAPIGAGGRYTVQKGDTLWRIATASYGNGNQWQRICDANPGLTPATLKAGQTIVIP